MHTGARLYKILLLENKAFWKVMNLIKGVHVGRQNDENFSFFGQKKLGQRHLSSKKLTNLLVGGANTVQRGKI